jgi:hypothetical protein
MIMASPALEFNCGDTSHVRLYRYTACVVFTLNILLTGKPTTAHASVQRSYRLLAGPRAHLQICTSGLRTLLSTPTPTSCAHVRVFTYA